MTRRQTVPKFFPALRRGHPTVLIKQNSRLSIITTVTCLTVPFMSNMCYIRVVLFWVITQQVVVISY